MKRAKYRNRNDLKFRQSIRLKGKRRLSFSMISTETDGNVIVYQSELDYMSRCILDRKNIETGGQLFGFFTAKGTPVVCYAIGPGARANHQTTFFNQDLAYLRDVGDVLVKEFGLQHIGEWHSHHQLGLSHPSGHDFHTVHSTIEELHLGNFLLCIGICDEQSATVNAFLFKEGQNECREAKWIVKGVESPYRKVADERLRQDLCHPVTQEPALSHMKIARITLPQGGDSNYLLRAYI
jgi:hypothetical protein